MKSYIITSFLGLLALIGISSCKKTESVPAPVASFNWSASALTAPTTVTFTNTSTNATSYSWDFGDGNTSTSFNPTNRYTSGGSYTVKLTATGKGGTNTVSLTINILRPTALQINVRDGLGNAVSGATVKLYGTLSDWTNETNQLLTTQTTNASGVVVFTPLSPQNYYWKIVNGCQNNLYGSIATTNALAANNTTIVTSVLSATGTLVLNNNSSNPYDVYQNGTLLIASMPGGTSRSFVVPTGQYNIRVIQKSGFVLTPTDKAYTGNVNCGGSLTVNFP